MMERSCETCRHNLGGGYNNCRINLEAECAAGEFEAWEPKYAPAAEPARPVKMYRSGHGPKSWWACGECLTAISRGDKTCRGCGREINWDE